MIPMINDLAASSVTPGRRVSENQGYGSAGRATPSAATTHLGGTSTEQKEHDDGY